MFWHHLLAGLGPVGGTIFQKDLQDVIVRRLTGSPHVLLVADGIGGQPHGSIASRTALSFLASQACVFEGATGCEAALHAANQHLYELMNESDRIGMGTTVVGLVLQETAAIAFNVGDSRAYRLTQHGLDKLSQEDVATPPREAMHSSRHGITQSLGGTAIPLAIVPHILVGTPLRRGEKILLCSDGLTDAIDEGEIECVLRLSASPSVIASKLVRRAIIGGSRDNISVIVGACV